MANEAPAAAPPAVDSRDLDALRTLLLRRIETGEGEEAVALVMRLLTQSHSENVALHHRLHLALRARYGRKSYPDRQR